MRDRRLLHEPGGRTERADPQHRDALDRSAGDRTHDRVEHRLARPDQAAERAQFPPSARWLYPGGAALRHRAHARILFPRQSRSISSTGRNRSIRSMCSIRSSRCSTPKVRITIRRRARPRRSTSCEGIRISRLRCSRPGPTPAIFAGAVPSRQVRCHDLGLRPGLFPLRRDVAGSALTAATRASARPSRS